MIGLSLSLCIKDAIEGRVHPSDIGLIVAGTRAATEGQFEEVLSRYAETYWRENPNYGKSLARNLRNRNRLVQPRLLVGNYHEHNIAYGHWVITNEFGGTYLLARDMVTLQVLCEACGHYNTILNSTCLFCEETAPIAALKQAINQILEDASNAS